MGTGMAGNLEEIFTLSTQELRRTYIVHTEATRTYVLVTG